MINKSNLVEYSHDNFEIFKQKYEEGLDFSIVKDECIIKLIKERRLYNFDPWILFYNVDKESFTVDLNSIDDIVRVKGNLKVYAELHYVGPKNDLKSKLYEMYRYPMILKSDKAVKKYVFYSCKELRLFNYCFVQFSVNVEHLKEDPNINLLDVMKSEDRKRLLNRNKDLQSVHVRQNEMNPELIILELKTRNEYDTEACPFFSGFYESIDITDLFFDILKEHPNNFCNEIKRIDNVLVVSDEFKKFLDNE